MCRDLGKHYVLLTIFFAGGVRADEVLFRYEGDVLPLDPAGGFESGGYCEFPCAESIENGHLVLEWTGGGDAVNYGRKIARDPDPHPETLWIEWRYRSNFPLLSGEAGCDGRARQQYRNFVDVVYLHGDAAVSWSFGGAVRGIPVNTFYTLRFESLDGKHWAYAIDGQVFFVHMRNQPTPYVVSDVQFGGSGSCGPIGTSMRNEWDFVRYGTISDGEAIASADPPAGIVSQNEFPSFDRFVVAFDRPGFVYTSDIAVETTGSEVPVVLWVRRPDESGPETVQIVLDRPLALGETARFVFNTGGDPNVVEYTYLLFGPCCLPDGSCLDSDDTECDSLDGAFFPGGACPGPSACCLADGSCALLDPLCCENEGGSPPESPLLGKGGDCEGDADFDGLDGTCGDECPFDPDKTEPGQCGCGEPDTDNDQDSVANCVDVCPDEDDRIDENNDGIPDCRQFQPIPTTTAWGLVILAILLLTATKIAGLRRRLEERHS